MICTLFLRWQVWLTAERVISILANILVQKDNKGTILAESLAKLQLKKSGEEGILYPDIQLGHKKDCHIPMWQIFVKSNEGWKRGERI